MRCFSLSGTQIWHGGVGRLWGLWDNMTEATWDHQSDGDGTNARLIEEFFGGLYKAVEQHIALYKGGHDCNVYATRSLPIWTSPDSNLHQILRAFWGQNSHLFSWPDEPHYVLRCRGGREYSKSFQDHGGHQCSQMSFVSGQDVDYALVLLFWQVQSSFFIACFHFMVFIFSFFIFHLMVSSYGVMFVSLIRC
jgi:hypothetical protein